MTLIIVFGASVFAALMLCFLLLMGRSSAHSALLEQVTREARGSGPISEDDEGRDPRRGSVRARHREDRHRSPPVRALRDRRGRRLDQCGKGCR